MNDRRFTAVPPSVWNVGLVGVATLFAVIAVRFASQQSVWTDEATQLSGLSLGFADQLRWLAGRMPHAFTVPIDRMPPLSYWLGSLWTQAFGTSVRTIRYLSVCLSVASVFAIWAVARLYLERWMALICAAVLALSPNFVVESAEIRAYAAFIFFSTLLIFSYLKLLAAYPSPSRLELWGFAITALLCSYTHFFGMVISAGAFVCLLLCYLPVGWRAGGQAILRRAMWPLMFYVISMIGIMPFVLAAVKNSGAAHLGNAAVPLTVRLHDLVKLIYRLFSHQSMLGIPGLSAAAMLAGITLMAFAAVPGCNPRGRQLLLYLLVNFSLIALASLTTSAFGAFAPTYNVWALPVTALLAATALTHQKPAMLAAGCVCVSVLIAADCYAALRLSMSGETYAHTRSTVIKTLVDSAGPANVIVLYADDAPGLYFAMIYDYNARLRQYIAGKNAVHLIGSPAGSSSPWICDQDADTLLVAQDHELSAEALQVLVSHPGVHTQAYDELDDFLATHQADLADKWTLVTRNEYLAQSALAIAIFKARRVSPSPDSANCHAH